AGGGAQAEGRGIERRRSVERGDGVVVGSFQLFGQGEEAHQQSEEDDGADHTGGGGHGKGIQRMLQAEGKTLQAAAGRARSFARQRRADTQRQFRRRLLAAQSRQHLLS